MRALWTKVKQSRFDRLDGWSVELMTDSEAFWSVINPDGKSVNVACGEAKDAMSFVDGLCPMRGELPQSLGAYFEPSPALVRALRPHRGWRRTWEPRIGLQNAFGPLFFDFGFVRRDGRAIIRSIEDQKIRPWRIGTIDGMSLAPACETAAEAMLLAKERFPLRAKKRKREGSD